MWNPRSSRSASSSRRVESYLVLPLLSTIVVIAIVAHIEIAQQPDGNRLHNDPVLFGDAEGVVVEDGREEDTSVHVERCRSSTSRNVHGFLHGSTIQSRLISVHRGAVYYRVLSHPARSDWMPHSISFIHYWPNWSRLSYGGDRRYSRASNFVVVARRQSDGILSVKSETWKRTTITAEVTHDGDEKSKTSTQYRHQHRHHQDSLSGYQPGLLGTAAANRALLYPRYCLINPRQRADRRE